MNKTFMIRCLLLGAWMSSPPIPALMRAGVHPASEETRLPTIEDSFKIRRVGDPRISPEGEWIAFTVSRVDLEKQKSETRIWMKAVSGGEAVPMTMTGSSASRPRWSPDGRFLSFLSAREGGKTQVWALNRRGGEAHRLTDIPQGVSSYEWSPDGKRLLLLLRDPKPEDLEKDEKSEKKPEPWVIDRLQFKRDRIGYLDNRRTHIYLFTPGEEKPVPITSGDYDDSQPAWSPDGRRIAFVSNRTSEPDGNSNTDIWIVPADISDAGRTLVRVTTNPGADRSPAWSPDGRKIAYETVTRPEIIWYATNHLAVIEIGSDQPSVLTRSLDRNIASPRFSPDGRSICFILEDSGERHLARIDPDGGNLSRPIEGPLSVRAFALGKTGETISLISTPSNPGDVFRGTGNNLKRLTTVNDPLMTRLRLAEVENVHFPSRDGTEIEGFIYRPAGFDPAFRYPALLWNHGGPVSQYDFSFNFTAQLFSAHGYVVILVNPRGSSGYGQEFSLGIYRRWGEKDFEDVMAGVDYAVGRGYADPDRLGVGGWSYGGILTNYVITQTDRFKAAATGASEVLFVSNYGHDHYQMQWEKELGLPWENRELWEKLSPFNAVEKIVTPTLIMGGEKDWNVPILNSEQLYQALRRLGRPVRLVVYPGESHGIRRPDFQADRYRRYLEWFDRYVKSAGRVPGNPPT